MLPVPHSSRQPGSLISKKAMRVSARTLFLQLLKFGVSGILGVTISAVLYYGLRGRLPQQLWSLWFITVANIFDLGYYLLTTIIGGSVHFALSKLWVFVKQK
jgi:hypothetical protein